MSSLGKWKSRVGQVVTVNKISKNPLQLPAIEVQEDDDDETTNTVCLRRFCFLTKEQKTAEKNKKLGIYSPADHQNAQMVHIDSVASPDDDDIEDAVLALVRDVLGSIYFKGVVFFVIVLNAFYIAMQTFESMNNSYEQVFFVIDALVSGIFFTEVALKLYSGFAIFWKDPWNTLDFIILFITMSGPKLSFMGGARLIRLIRVVRAVKGLKTLTSIAGLTLVIETIITSLSDLANVMLLFVIVLLVFSVIGVKLFAAELPEDFEGPLQCVVTIFSVLTQDGWYGIFNKFKVLRKEKKIESVTYTMAYVYFVVNIILSAFLLSNLMVAVVTTNLDRAMQDMKKEKNDSRNSLAMDTMNQGEDAEDQESEKKEKVDLLYYDDIIEETKQTKGHENSDKAPLYKCDLSYITTEKLENYLLLKMALDQNLEEHKRLLDTLGSILRQVQGLNDAAKDAKAAKLLVKNDENQAGQKDSDVDTTLKSDIKEDELPNAPAPPVAIVIDETNK